MFQGGGVHTNQETINPNDDLEKWLKKGMSIMQRIRTPIAGYGYQHIGRSDNGGTLRVFKKDQTPLRVRRSLEGRLRTSST